MVELVAGGQGSPPRASPRRRRRRSSRAHAVHPITALQSEYSLWTRDPEDGVLDTCRELGIGFVAYSPLGRGFLTGEDPRPPTLDESDFRRHKPRFTGETFEQEPRARRASRGDRREQERHAGPARARLGARPRRRRRPDPGHQATAVSARERRGGRPRPQRRRRRGARSGGAARGGSRRALRSGQHETSQRLTRTSAPSRSSTTTSHHSTT